MPDIKTITSHKRQKITEMLERIVDQYGHSSTSPKHCGRMTREVLEAALSRQECNAMLNAIGVPSEIAKRFSKSNICSMLSNETSAVLQLYEIGYTSAQITAILCNYRAALGRAYGVDWLFIYLTMECTVCIMAQKFDPVNLRAIKLEHDAEQFKLPPENRDDLRSPRSTYNHPYFHDLKRRLMDKIEPSSAEFSEPEEDDLEYEEYESEMPEENQPPVPDIEAPPSAPVPPTGSGGTDALTGLLVQAMVPMVRDALRADQGTLTETRVDEMITKAIQERMPRMFQPPARSEGEDLPPGELAHEALPQVLKTVGIGLNVMLIGPAGSGKTTTAQQVATALKVPFHFTGAVDSSYKLTGFIDAGGNLVRTAFREAYENGGLFLFDEVDASAPGALMAFNAALANGLADFPDKVVKRHEDFFCVAAANTYGRGADRIYVGRNQLDGATLDRFAVIDFDYDETLENAMAGEGMGDWVKFVQKIRKAIFNLKLRYVVSPRASRDGARLLRAGMSRVLTEEMVVWKGMDKETRSKVQQEARV